MITRIKRWSNKKEREGREQISGGKRNVEKTKEGAGKFIKRLKRGRKKMRETIEKK